MTGAARFVPTRTRRWLRSHGGPLGSIVAVRTDAPEFVLTYDDGPEPGGTDTILRVLESRGAHATFFVLMTRTRRHPALLRDVVAAGHEVGLHGLDHRAISQLAYREVLERTSRAKAELADALARDVRWFRPPYGLQSLTSFRAVRAAGLEPVLWGPTAWGLPPGYDGRTDGKGAARRTARRHRALHDGYPKAEDGGRGGDRPDLDRGELASLILDAYGALGLRATTLSSAIAAGAATRGLWFRR